MKRQNETPISHVLFVMALGLVLLVVVNLLGCDTRERHRETLIEENKELHYLNMLKSEIIEEIMADNEVLREVINECGK